MIGAKPIHLTRDDELKRSITLDSLRIDMGPSGSGKVKVGDRADLRHHLYPDRSQPARQSPGRSPGRGNLDRAGSSMPRRISTCRQLSPSRKRVGLRGARVAAYAFDPDLAIVLDSTPAIRPARLGWYRKTRYNTRLGCGPAIYCRRCRHALGPAPGAPPDTDRAKRWAFLTSSASPAAAGPTPAPSTSSAPASPAFLFQCLDATITARLRWCVYLIGSIP